MIEDQEEIIKSVLTAAKLIGYKVRSEGTDIYKMKTRGRFYNVLKDKRRLEVDLFYDEQEIFDSFLLNENGIITYSDVLGFEKVLDQLKRWIA